MIGDGALVLFKYKCTKCKKVNYFGRLPGEKIDWFNRFAKSKGGR
jgi:phage FluMu protein Com